MEANDNILQWIEAWLRGELGAEETAELERLMAEDAEFETEVNIYKEAFETLDETSWKLTEFNPELERAKDYLTFYTEEKNKAYLEELNSISVDNKQRHSKLNVRSIFGAVGIAAVLVLGVIFLRDGGQSTDYSALYAEYTSLEEIPTFTVRGRTEDSLLNQVETQFHARNFEKVNTIVELYGDDFDEEQTSLISLYHGVAFGERGMYDEAYNVLSNKDLYANSMYNQMPEWYLAMILLKSEPDRARAIEMLKTIANDDEHYKHKEAKQILSKL